MNKADAIVSEASEEQRLSGLDVVFVDLVASQELLENVERDTPRLSPTDCLRVERLAGDPTRQSLWRAARIATRIVLERAAGSAIRGVDFEIATGGRPQLGDGFPHFNVSHTGDVALIAVCRTSPIGVDIERQRALSMSPERRRRIVAVSGVAAAAGCDDLQDYSDLEVLRSWVRLEALAKARGSGIGVLLTEEGVIGGAAGERHPPFKTSCITVAGLDVAPPYLAAIAAETLPQKIAVEAFPANAGELAEFISAGGKTIAARCGGDHTS